MQTLKQIVFLSLWWIPRIAGILFALFLTVFSFDVFGQGEPVWKTAMAFIIHNIPTIVLLIVMYFSWRRSWLGAMAFFVLGVVFFLLMPNKAKSIFIVLPLLITAVLFFLNWVFRSSIRKAKETY